MITFVWENILSGLFPLLIAYVARKCTVQQFVFGLNTTRDSSVSGRLSRFVTGIYSKELLLFLIASIFVLGEFCESVFYFVFNGSGTFSFFEVFTRGHNFEQEIYLFELPSVFTFWQDGVPLSD